MTAQEQAVSGRAGKDSARQIGSGQRQPGQGRAGQAENYRTGPGGATKGRLVPYRVGQDLA